MVAMVRSGIFVEEYKPGRSIKFRFTKPKGFKGFHGFEVLSNTEPSVVLRHTIEMTLHGSAFFDLAAYNSASA